MKYEEVKPVLENGKAIYRDGWDPKGWVTYVAEHVVVGITLPVKESKLVFYNGEANDGTYVPYEPSDEDVKASDWHVFGEPDPQLPKPPKDEPKPVPAKQADKAAAKPALKQPFKR